MSAEPEPARSDVARERPLATLWSRALAFLVDSSLSSGPVVLGGVGLLTLGAFPIAGRIAVMVGLASLIAYCGVALLWVHRDGQSPGKKLLGICLRDLHGGRVSLARVIWLRNAIPFVLTRIPLAGPFLSVADHAAALTKHRRCVHDHIAGTEVVQATTAPLSVPARALVVVLAVILAPIYIGLIASIEAFEVEGPSTEPGLLNGDRIAAATGFYLLYAPIAAGDVVVARSPMDGVFVIKRVVGMPGDLVETRDNVLFVNGTRVPARDVGPCTLGMGAKHSRCRVYASSLGTRNFQISYARDTIDSEPFRVPEGHFYLLGDHRDSSNDSRNPAFGAVPLDAIHAVAMSIYWSSDDSGIRWDRFGTAVR